MVKGSPDTLNALQRVLNNLRDRDRRETELSDWTPAELADSINKSATKIVVACLGVRPVFAFGTYPLTRTSRQVWGFGTDETPRVMRAVSKYASRVLIPDERKGGVHRFELRLPSAHITNIHWLRMLGAKIEGTLYGFGPNGEQFTQLSMVFPPCVTT